MAEDKISHNPKDDLPNEAVTSNQLNSFRLAQDDLEWIKKAVEASADAVPKEDLLGDIEEDLDLLGICSRRPRPNRIQVCVTDKMLDAVKEIKTKEDRSFSNTLLLLII